MSYNKFHGITNRVKLNNGKYCDAFFICSGPYGLETYICGDCRELFVIDCDLLAYKNETIESFLQGKVCPSCYSPLSENIKKYPYNIYFEDKWMICNEECNTFPDELIELKEIFKLN